ncbi:MAG: glutathione S-transferase family protein [Alphaproteobacteria bacterium]
MELFYSPGACSVGIHVLLEETGKPFTLHKVDLRKQEQYQPDYTGINPKSKVPALKRDDGTILTEFPAIATWIARTNPQKHLLPVDVEGEARALEAMDYVVATVHMQGFTRMVRPGNFTPNEADHEKVQARGAEIFAKGLQVMDKALAGKDYVTGAFSIADAALFYAELWAATRTQIALGPNCAAHYARMKARPAVQRALAAEGLTG